MMSAFNCAFSEMRRVFFCGVEHDDDKDEHEDNDESRFMGVVDEKDVVLSQDGLRCNGVDAPEDEEKVRER